MFYRPACLICALQFNAFATVIVHTARKHTASQMRLLLDTIKNKQPLNYKDKLNLMYLFSCLIAIKITLSYVNKYQIFSIREHCIHFFDFSFLIRVAQSHQRESTKTRGEDKADAMKLSVVFVDSL